MSQQPQQANASYPFPTTVPFDKAEVERDFWRCQHTRAQDRSFHFTIAIPRSWKPVDVPAATPTPDRPLSSFAFFRSLEGARGEIEVSAALLDREVAPGDWLDILLEGRGEQVLNRRDVETKGGTVSDILSRAATPGGGVISRWIAIKDGGAHGGRIFVLQARATEADYSRFANTFFMAVASFALLHPGDFPLAESLKTFSRAVPGDFLMMYPESWHLKQDESSNDNALVLQLSNAAADKVLGKITFAVIARAAEASHQHLLDNYIAELRRGGLPIPPLKLDVTDPIGGCEAAWRTYYESPAGQTRTPSSYSATDQQAVGGRIEIRALVGKRPDAWFLIAMLGPARQAFPGMWAINKRAFAILTDYLRTSPVGERQPN